MTKLQEKIDSNTAVKVIKVNNTDQFERAKKIRFEVFVIGQNVPAEEEFDQYEDISIHFLAYHNDIACGAARWRITENGVKLERFAVLEDFRGLGVGSALVREVLNDIKINTDAKGKNLYLHAQLSAMKLYSKFGFIQDGELFQECDIDHYKMVK